MIMTAILVALVIFITVIMIMTAILVALALEHRKRKLPDYFE